MDLNKLIEIKVDFSKKLVGDDLQACKDWVRQFLPTVNKKYYDLFLTERKQGESWFAFHDREHNHYELRAVILVLKNNEPAYVTHYLYRESIGGITS